MKVDEETSKTEPKRKFYEFEIWLNVRTGQIREYYHFLCNDGFDGDSWRKIRVREIER